MTNAAEAVRRGPMVERTYAVLGFGLFLVTYGGGPFGFISGSTQRDITWESLLFIQAAFFVAVAAGCLGVRLAARNGRGRLQEALGAAGYLAATLIGLVLQPVLDGMSDWGGVVIRAALSAGAGVLYAPPFMFWIGRLYDLGKASSHYGVVGVLVLCYLLCPTVLFACLLLEGLDYAYSIAVLICAVCSVAIQTLWLRRMQSASVHSDDRCPYRLTAYSVSLLGCLGFSWGVSDAVGIMGLVRGPAGETYLSVVASFVPMAAMAVALLIARGRRDMRFGTIVRFAVVVCGAVLAGLPLVYATVPTLLYPLGNLVMIAGEMALIIFTIDVCADEGRSTASVFALNFAVFMGAATVSSVLFYAIHALFEDQMAWLVVGTVSVWVVLMVIPFLPSRSSDAVILTSETLPENEGYEANVAMRRSLMARKYGLSEGEAVVLGHLMRGEKREEIAEAMGLSPWTVKARIGSLYRKCGVHSYKELIQLVSEDR